MTTTKTDSTAGIDDIVACDLTVFSPEERNRHMAEGRGLHGETLGFLKTERGVDIYFDKSVSPDRLKAWIKNEQRCCGVLTGAEVLSQPDRVVLTLESRGDGASSWAGMFMNMGGESTMPARDRGPMRQEPGSISRKGGLWAGIIAAGISLACVLPIIGAYLVGRGLLPKAWNISEGTYLIAGGIALAVWAGWNFRKRTSKRKLAAANGVDADTDAGNCGC